MQKSSQINTEINNTQGRWKIHKMIDGSIVSYLQAFCTASPFSNHVVFFFCSTSQRKKRNSLKPLLFTIVIYSKSNSFNSLFQFLLVALYQLHLFLAYHNHFPRILLFQLCYRLFLLTTACGRVRDSPPLKQMAEAYHICPHPLRWH